MTAAWRLLWPGLRVLLLPLVPVLALASLLAGLGGGGALILATQAHGWGVARLVLVAFGCGAASAALSWLCRGLLARPAARKLPPGRFNWAGAPAPNRRR